MYSAQMEAVDLESKKIGMMFEIRNGAGVALFDVQAVDFMALAKKKQFEKIADTMWRGYVAQMMVEYDKHWGDRGYRHGHGAHPAGNAPMRSRESVCVCL